MRNKTILIALVLLSFSCLNFPAFADDSLEFTPVGVYWNTACSTSGYVTLCGKEGKDDWYVLVKNKTDKTFTSGIVSFVLLVDTKSGSEVSTGATLDFFRKFRASSGCDVMKAAEVNVLGPKGCGFIGSVGGNNTLEWADVPIFDYKYLSQKGIVRAGVRINWTVRDDKGVLDSGTYTFYPEILAK